MKHALRKYISPCGSALFMVVSTMAALIVLVTAMYMSVLSSRQVQYASFDQEQAYVSSTSIADIMGSYIADSKNASSELVKKITALKAGESISTNGNDFASLSASGTKDDTTLGGYTVDVTRLSDETIAGTTWHIYDLAVTVSNNEIVETTHTFLRTKDPEPEEIPEIDRFFTATGYVPNDTLVSAININSTAYYDSEYVKFGEIESGYPDEYKPNTVTIRSGLICAGSVVFDKGPNIHIQVDKPTDWYIGNNMTIETGTFNCDLGGTGSVEASENRGRILVGGNLEIKDVTNIGSINAPTDVYVLGDVKITAPITIYGNLYVGGNVTISSNASFYGQSKIYHSGRSMDLASNPWSDSLLLMQYNGSYTTMEEVLANRWDTEISSELTISPSDVGTKLDDAIGASVYPKWTVDVDDAKKNVKNIIFNGYYEAVTPVGIEVVDGDGNFTPLTSYYDEISASSAVEPSRIAVIDSDCTIGDIVDIGQINGGKNIASHTIIFDTGTAGNILTVNLQPNMRLNGSDEPNGFAWAVAYAGGDVLDPHSDEKLTDSQPGQSMSIVTIGDGTLVINVPDGVTYQSAPYEFVGHYAWLKLMGGYYNTTTGAYHNNIDGNNASKAKASIHVSDGCTSCVYEPAKNEDGEKGYTCQTHGGFIEGDKPDSCACDGRIEKSKFTGDLYMYEGLPQKPNVNIWLVSSSESADIQIGCMKYETGVEKTVRSEFYGYIYAPYMTYMDMSAANAQGLKCCGGLIVSDYIMSGYFDYVFALPDMSLEEIVGDDFAPATPNASRTWRVHGV